MQRVNTESDMLQYLRLHFRLPEGAPFIFVIVWGCLELYVLWFFDIFRIQNHVYLDNRLIQRVTVGLLLFFLVQCTGLLCVMSCLCYARNNVVHISPNCDIIKF